MHTHCELLRFKMRLVTCGTQLGYSASLIKIQICLAHNKLCFYVPVFHHGGPL